MTPQINHQNVALLLKVYYQNLAEDMLHLTWELETVMNQMKVVAEAYMT